MHTNKEGHTGCVRRRLKRHKEHYVRTVNVDFAGVEDLVSEYYLNHGYSFVQIEQALKLLVDQIKKFINKNIGLQFHTKSSIKCLDFWVYYTPKSHDEATVTIQLDPQKDFLKPVRHYAGLSYPDYGDEMEARLKVSDDGFGNAARYDDAIKLYEENVELKRRIAWLEKQLVLK